MQRHFSLGEEYMKFKINTVASKQMALKKAQMAAEKKRRQEALKRRQEALKRQEELRQLAILAEILRQSKLAPRRINKKK